MRGEDPNAGADDEDEDDCDMSGGGGGPSNRFVEREAESDSDTEEEETLGQLAAKKRLHQSPDKSDRSPEEEKASAERKKKGRKPRRLIDSDDEEDSPAPSLSASPRSQRELFGSSSRLDLHPFKNLCTVCKVDMGDQNGRQLCGKTYCMNEAFLDEEEAATDDLW